MGPTKPPIGWVAQAISQRIKLPGLEADHLSPPGFKFKNDWSCTSESLV